MAISFDQNWFSQVLEAPYTSGAVFWLVVSLLLYVVWGIAMRKSKQQDEERSCSDVENMTLEEAYLIKTRIADEFPMVFSSAINFVFFKAEAIPSIAKLIARATPRSSSSSKKPPQRGPGVTPADLLSRPRAPERKAAIDRVNHIHSFYRPSGKMSDADLLYVLSLFALEPMRWIERLEGRCLTDEERCALAMLWRAVGEELRIPYDRLPSYVNEDGDGDGDGSGDGNGFRDALHWLAELEDWGQGYEKEFREKSPESEVLAQRQLDAWVGGVPGFLRPWARDLVAAFIEPGLRQAMGIETPSATAIFLVETAIRVRKFIRCCFYG
ncbi:hypothetical protein GGR55DRAFT_291179 [Xylaria sp. FL0064]|nr:hypothetical protein GGR55DRAFT_291179 [Xylaria sp. FL0064]